MRVGGSGSMLKQRPRKVDGILSSSSFKIVEEGKSWRRLRGTKLPEKHRFFKKFFILYWSIVDLQCCVSFRCTAK